MRMFKTLCLLVHAVQRGDVEYSLNAIPLGGFVAFPDEKDPNNKFKAGANSYSFTSSSEYRVL